MARKNAIFLTNENIEGGSTQNAHVFDGHYDLEAKEWQVTSKKSRCGQVNIKNPYQDRYILQGTDETKFCHDLVDGHGKKFNLCGICMSTFFADSE